MSFEQLFPLPEDDDEVEQDVPHIPWWGPPEKELGVCLGQALVIGRSERAVIALSHVFAFSTGLQFELVASAHGVKQSSVQGVFGAQHFDPSEPVPDAFIRVGLELPDGTRVSNLGRRRMHGPADGAPEGPIFHQSGGGGGSGSRGGVTMRPGYWLWPLPEPGDLQIWCEWPLFEVELSRATISGAPLVEAASRSARLWE